MLLISENMVLFSIIGTMYGGDGQVAFRLPDFRGRAPIHVGHGDGLSPRSPGQAGGAEQQTLSIAQMPAHNHHLIADSSRGHTNATSPQNSRLGNTSPTQIYSTSTVPTTTTMHPATITVIGGSQPVATMPPFLCATFMIATQGAPPQ
jgi:microcystin-dependent protein